MKRRLFLLVFLLSMAKAGLAMDYYVSPQGNDSWSGTLPTPNAQQSDGPFQTIEKARDQIRERADRSETVHVWIRGGVYSLEKPLIFTQADSGEKDAKILYQAYPNEKPLWTGGKPLTGWVPWKGHILKTNVAQQGLEGVYFRQLIYDGVRQILARYPNFDAENPYAGGWAYADGEHVAMYAEIPDLDKRTFQFREENRRNWSRPEELRVMVFPRYNWWNNICDVASVDSSTRTVKLKQDASYQIRPGDRYYFENALEELDAPGEWYLDRQTWELYFWPPDSCDAETLNQKLVTAPVNRRLVELQSGTAFVEFHGLTLENSTHEAITMRETVACVVQQCTIRNVGCYHSTAIFIQGGKGNGVRGCEISYIGGTAIGLGGGETEMLTASENFAEHCRIHHTGLDYKQGVGISMTGVGNRASHNEIHHCPRFGIGFGGNNQIIEYNEIHHVNLETADTGAIYTGGRNWISSRGTQVRYNYFHDVIGFGYQNGEWKSPHYCWGIYLDDNTGGVDVYGNIVVGCIRGLIHLHNGRDNHIWNNIFVDGTLQQFEANGWTVQSDTWKRHFQTMVPGYESVAGKPAWKSMRNMELHPKDAPLEDGTVMSGNRVWGNIFCYNSDTVKCYRVRNFNPRHNEIDRNLIWNHGKPIVTETTSAFRGKVVAEVPLKNADFEEGETEQFPTAWSWQVRPSSKTVAVMDETHPRSGKKCLRLEADYVAEKKRDNTPAILLSKLVLKPGTTYRLSGYFRASQPDTRVHFLVHHYTAGKHYWGSPGGGQVGTEWQELETVFKIPAPGEGVYRDFMEFFNITIGNPSREGSTLYADDIRLEELETLSVWEGWQALGFDRNSLIADPLFVDESHGDYRLKPDSPAFSLGFEPIPIEKIGPQSPFFKD